LTPDSRALISLGLGPNHPADGLTVRAVAGSPEGLTTQASSAEPEANTLASVHSLSQ
jgi:hypothetical protein